MKGNFFVVNRAIFDDETFQSRPYSELCAWIYLIAKAAYGDREVDFGGGRVFLKRGQLVTTERRLAAEWGWTRDKVRRFLLKLTRTKNLTIERTARRTIITVENYGKYQDSRTKESTTNRTTNRTSYYKDKKNKKNVQHRLSGIDGLPPEVKDLIERGLM